jgi:hypothetical protein
VVVVRVQFVFFAGFGVDVGVVLVFFARFCLKRGFDVAVSNVVVFCSSPVLDGDGLEVGWWWLTDLGVVVGWWQLQ